MTANIFPHSSVELKQMLDPTLLLISMLLSCLYCLFEQFHSLIPLLIWDHKSTCWRTNDSVWFIAWKALCTQLITELQRYLKHGEYIILTNFFICSIRRSLLSSNTQWNRLFPPCAKSSESHAHTQTHTHTHTHTHTENTACFFPLSLLLDCGNLRGLFMIYEKKTREGTLTKKNFKCTKEESAEKSSLPVKKGPCARLLPNVGVPKILPDRKFPILRCVLKSCSHPNAVTIILLTLIASLHPHYVPPSLRPSPPRKTGLYLQYGAGLCWLLLITCGWASGTVCSTGRWLLITMHTSPCFSLGATICQENRVYSQWHACNFEIESWQFSKNCSGWKSVQNWTWKNVTFKREIKTAFHILCYSDYILLGQWIKYNATP